MDNKKRSKHDRAWNIVKSGDTRTKKGFQNVQPIVNKFSCA